MKRMVRQFRSFVAGVISALLLSAMLVGGAGFLGGCSDAAETTDLQLPSPGVGSVFSTHIEQSQLKQALFEGDYDVTVRAADMIVEGKERVAQFSADTLNSLICYEPNGDLSMYMKKGVIEGCEVENAWLRFPFGGNDNVTQSLMVTRREGSDSTPVNCMADWTAHPAGEEQIMINNEPIATRKVIAEFRLRSEKDSVRGPIRSRRYELWYAPEIGYVVREHVFSFEQQPDSVAADTIGVSRRQLTHYVLKN